jgi:DNA-binding LacI/PurR family transcriptional regulator
LAKGGRLTQRDIARLAGVSQATVSLVLNDAKAAEGRIPDETRERVQKAIRETGYVADPIARRMAKGLNRILGVFTYEPAFPSAQADFFAPFLFGIEETAQTLGYDLLLLTGAPSQRGKRKIFHENNRLRLADGCLILGREFDRDELTRLVAGDYPFVAVGRRDDAGGPVSYVGGDYAAGTSELVRQVRELGHRRLAYVGPSEGAESTVDRWRGFVAALDDGLEPVAHVPAAARPPEEVLAAIRDSRASAVFFTELADAVAVESLARQRGLAVPRDFSIVVLGSHIRVEQPGTRFTSFDIPREAMGREATRLLVRRIEATGGIEQKLLPCPPLPGETLGPPPTA